MGIQPRWPTFGLRVNLKHLILGSPNCWIPLMILGEIVCLRLIISDISILHIHTYPIFNNVQNIKCRPWKNTLFFFYGIPNVIIQKILRVPLRVPFYLTITNHQPTGLDPQVPSHGVCWGWKWLDRWLPTPPPFELWNSGDRKPQMGMETAISYMSMIYIRIYIYYYNIDVYEKIKLGIDVVTLYSC